MKITRKIHNQKDHEKDNDDFHDKDNDNDFDTYT